MKTSDDLSKNKQIDVWKIKIPEFYSEEKYYYSLLNDAEKKRAEAFVTDKLTSRYTISQGALRVILADYLSIDPTNIIYSFGFHKKPFLADNPSNLQFNLTHSHDIALVAISFHDQVGVDVERLNPKILEKGLEKSIFSQNELKVFQSTSLENRTEAFFSGWTHKESLLKLSGIGLYKELQEVEVPLHPIAETSPVLFEGSEQFLQSFYVSEKYLAAVASTKPYFDVVRRKFRE